MRRRSHPCFNFIFIFIFIPLSINTAYGYKKKIDLVPDYQPKPTQEDPFQQVPPATSKLSSELFLVEMQITGSSVQPRGQVPFGQNESFLIEDKIKSMNTISLQGRHWLSTIDSNEASNENENIFKGLLLGVSLAQKSLSLTTSQGYNINQVDFLWISTRFGGTLTRKFIPEFLWIGVDGFITADSWQFSHRNTSENWSTWVYNGGAGVHLDFLITSSFQITLGIEHFWDLNNAKVSMPNSQTKLGFNWEF